ncbi:hypothetical protein GJ496_002847 [Pomphorhynchus laevis]|nr:hypothetical protein GJ496_002847 [Pomphorhynchus laevis]
MRDKFTQIFQPQQAGVAVANDADLIIHQVRRLHEQMHTSENWVWTKVDVSNAFNTVDRQCFIDAVDIKAPSIGPWIKWCYSQPSKLRFGAAKSLT